MDNTMSTHRSFRLTSATTKDGPASISLVIPLGQQAVVLLMAGMVLDGGMLLNIFGCVVLGCWVCAWIILSRRRNRLTPVDKVVIRLGFLIACTVVFVLIVFVSN